MENIKIELLDMQIYFLLLLRFEFHMYFYYSVFGALGLALNKVILGVKIKVEILRKK